MRRPRWVLLFAIWTLVALLVTAQTLLRFGRTPGAIPWGSVIGFQVAYWNGWALVTPLVFWLASARPFGGARRWRTLGEHALAALGVSVVMLAWWAFLTRRLEPFGRGAAPPSLAAEFLHWFGIGFHYDLVTYGAILGIGLALDSHARLRERELSAARLEARLAEAQLEALRFQLQPHFLFNTLHAIASLVEADPSAARRMIARLGGVLRQTLELGGRPEVTLREELEIVDGLLDLEAVRFADRLRIERTIEPAALDALVPGLVLQPLVENALRHGIARRAGPGTVSLRASRVGDELVLVVADDGPGPALDPARGGIGLENTRARLAQMHGTGASLRITAPASGGCEVTVRLPWRIAREDEPA